MQKVENAVCVEHEARIRAKGQTLTTERPYQLKLYRLLLTEIPANTIKSHYQSVRTHN